MKQQSYWTRSLNFLFLSVFVLTLAQSLAAQPFRNRFRDQTKPNIILIVADDLGYGDLGCYGQKRIQTPNIDQLASEGMLFTQAYAGAATDAPAEASLMTGLHGGHHSIRFNNDQPLSPTDLTIAEHFAAEKYLTGGTGKWSLGSERTTGSPTLKGFGDWVGYVSHAASLDPYPEQIWRGSLDGDRIVTLDGNQNGGRKVYVHDTFDKVAFNFVRGERFKPFFLYAHFTLPHATQLKGGPGRTMSVPSDAPYSTESWPQAEKNKAAMITRLDRYVGKLLKQLTHHDLDHLTTIIFTSDNGPHKEAGVDPKFFNSTGSLRGHKPDLYEGNLRVPFIVRWSEHVAPATRNNEVCALWDIFPTVTELAGLKPPANTDGISLAPTLLGQAQTNHHDSLYWEHRTASGVSQAARMENWKGIRSATGPEFELYDLAKDPGEQTNTAAQNPDVVARITAYLDQFADYTPPPSAPTPVPTLISNSTSNPPVAANQEPEAPTPESNPSKPSSRPRIALIALGLLFLVGLIAGVSLKKRKDH